VVQGVGTSKCGVGKDKGIEAKAQAMIKGSDALNDTSS